MGDTTISWCARPGTRPRTWNPTQGCALKSEGCRNCYAMRQARRFAGPGKPFDGLVNLKTGKWTGEVKFAEHKLAEPFSWREESTVFVDSMSDLFYERFSNQQIAAVFGVMAATKHTYQILTKRADRMREWFQWIAKEARECNGGVGMTPAARCFIYAQNADAFFQFDGKPTHLRRAVQDGDVVQRALSASWPLSNVWLGVSVENQDAADDRVRWLIDTPAAVRFLSCEPLLSSVDLRSVGGHGTLRIDALTGCWAVPNDLPRVPQEPRINWVIVGAESGPGARECKAEWLRDVRDQCRAARVPLWLKQAVATPGRLAPGCVATWIVGEDSGSTKKGYGFGGTMIERPYLDGKQHLEFPHAT